MSWRSWFLRVSSRTSSVVIVDLPACLLKFSRSIATFSKVVTGVEYVSVLGHKDWEGPVERTYLSPDHLGQRPDELWGDIAVALQHLFVNHFANCKPQRRLEPL